MKNNKKFAKRWGKKVFAFATPYSNQGNNRFFQNKKLSLFLIHCWQAWVAKGMLMWPLLWNILILVLMVKMRAVGTRRLPPVTIWKALCCDAKTARVRLLCVLTFMRPFRIHQMGKKNAR